MEAIGILIMFGSQRQITEAWAWMPRFLKRGGADGAALYPQAR